MKNIYACEMEVKIFFYVWKTVIEDEIIGDSRSYTGLVKNLQLAIWPLLCESTFQLASATQIKFFNWSFTCDVKL